MKKIYILLLSMFVLPCISHGQYSVTSRNEDIGSKAQRIAIKLPESLNLNIKNMAYHRYMRKKRRYDRNFFETRNSFYITQYAFDNWASGGENSFNGKLSTQTQYVYHYDKVAVDLYLNAAYGLGTSNKVMKKLEDYFQFNGDVSYRLYGKWNYTFGVNVASQFSPTYTYDKDNNKTGYKSAFFAPGTIKPYVGITFKIADNQKITIAPISGNIIMVLDEKLSNLGYGGVEKGKKTKTTVGGYINMQWNQNITKNGMLKYKTIVQSFCDYKTVPNLNWENWVECTIFKILSINLYVKFIYDKKIETPEEGNYFQIKQSLGFGIAYNFKNKNKPSYTIIK